MKTNIEDVDKLLDVVCKLRDEDRYADLHYFLGDLPSDLRDDLSEFMALINKEIKKEILDD